MKLKDEKFGYVEPALFIVRFVFGLYLLVVVFAVLFLVGALVLSKVNLYDHTELIVKLLILPIIYPFFTVTLNLLRSVEIGNPFTIENIKRIQFLGFYSISFSLLFSVLAIIQTIADLPLKGIILEINGNSTINVTGFIFGTVILIISEVFRVGLKLKKENELTV